MATVGLGGYGAAQASTLPTREADPLAPIVHGQSQFFTQDQIQDVWTEVIDNYPDDLPEGREFPADPVSYFPEIESVDSIYFEVGLVEATVGEFWKCAWLDEKLTNGSAARAVQEEVHEELVKADGVTSPFMVEDVDGAWANFVTESAKANGTTEEQFEYDQLCTGNYEAEVNK